MSAELVTLNSNWLDNVQGNNNCAMTLTTTGILGGISSTLYTHDYYPYWTTPVYVSSPTRPIKLTLSEIERLRKAAKADDKLKAILSKFTDQIEITVDFD